VVQAFADAAALQRLAAMSCHLTWSSGSTVRQPAVGRSREVTAADFFQKPGHGLVQLGQVLVQHSPDFGTVQPGIAMHQNISEVDQLALARHPRAKHRVQPGQLAQGFADVLQLPFNRRPGQEVGVIPFWRDPFDKAADGGAGLLHVPKERCWVALHAA
jgi:hypothetical protein